MKIVPVRFKHLQLKMCADNNSEIIQQCHAQGRFYKDGELKYLEALIPPKPFVLDIEAYVGNYTAFFANVCRCAEVILYEANQVAIKIFKKISESTTSPMSNTISRQNGWIIASDPRVVRGYATKQSRRHLVL